ncbi:VWA domain-containing protein [Tundrisphaera lichenicola]|uniref:VWA domain-containing protein n=1 Tax=Tundrisphaera lichenicola TaxID=2029860 RepID=UPI003EBAA45C
MSTLMGNLAQTLTVGRPWWLILLPLLIVPLVLFSYKSLSGLGKVRRVVAILIRASVVTAIVLALAEVSTVQRNEKLTTMYVVDTSESIPQEYRGTILSFVTEDSKKRNKTKDDQTGVIVFGKEPKVETPPQLSEANLMLGIENTVDSEYTDLGGAIKLALATFPEDSARRIVVVSDGNENRGNAIEQAIAAKELGIQIDVLPVDYFYDKEVLVEKVSLPPDVKKGETVNINVVVRASEPSRGTLQIFQKDSDNRSVPAPGNEKPVPVELRRGVNVFTLKQLINEPSFYTFTAEFVPEKGSGDRRAINNVATGFTYSRGTAQVLLIEGTRGEHAELVRALREKKLEVKTLVAPGIGGGGSEGGDSLPDDLGQLQPFDTVILGNVPKDSVTESQQRLIEANVHDMGAGLIMLGGENSFGAGGWLNSPIEKALPVDMQIKAMKVQGKGALVQIMHATEIPEGNYWMKVIAQEAIKTLSSYDYCGMVHWEGQEAWLFTIKPVGNGKASMLRAIDRMTPGDMPAFDPTLQLSLNGLRKVQDAMTKHIILISDGDPAAPSPQVIKQLIANKITVTTVIVAAHGNDPGSIATMRDIAVKTKGRFYQVTNPKALPRIYQKEARIISRPLIFEQPKPWLPNVKYTSEPIVGLSGDLPPITGLVQTSPKESELVEVPIVSPLPAEQPPPLLAHWTYGLGRSVAFTSDAGRKWTTAWPSWENYAAFWSQVVRWSMRPVDNRNLTLNVRREEGKIKVVVDALDKESQFLNFLQIQGSILSPDLKRTKVDLVQTAPGRYEGVVENAEASGNYFVNLGYSGPDNIKGVVSTGVSVPYSDEYRELRSNPGTLETVASLTNGQVLSWKKRADGSIDLARTLAESQPFRRDAFTQTPRALSPLWPLLLFFSATMFLGDVAIRRVSPDFERMGRLIRDQWQKMRGREVAPPVEYMEKLKSRKAEVGDQIDRSRAATRYEAPPPSDIAQVPNVVEDLMKGGAAANRPAAERRPQTQAPGMAPTGPQAEPESYTNRLLKAKNKVWEDREKDQKDKGKS